MRALITCKNLALKEFKTTGLNSRLQIHEQTFSLSLNWTFPGTLLFVSNKSILFIADGLGIRHCFHFSYQLSFFSLFPSQPTGKLNSIVALKLDWICILAMFLTRECFGGKLLNFTGPQILDS